MYKAGLILRKQREDGKIGNYKINHPDVINKVSEDATSVIKEENKFYNTHRFIDGTITLEQRRFKKVRLDFEYFDKSNIFACLSNKTVLQTLENKRYTKFTSIVFEKYNSNLGIRIGDFLMLLKKNKDDLYKMFLNPYGDEKYCKFKISDNEILDKKGLYFYKLGNDIIYIGRCRDNFYNRFNQGYGIVHPENCYLDGQSTNCHINSLINKAGNIIGLYVCIMTDDLDIESIKRELIQKYRPKWNLTLKKPKQSV